jgi:hypothetical protein
MFRMGFEPTTPVLNRAKTVHALDRAATVTIYVIRHQVEISDGLNYFMRHAVAYLVEALCYKPEGRGFVSR